MNGVVVHSSGRRRRVLTAQQRQKYLQKFKQKLKSPKLKFIAMMKMGLKCLLENERFMFKLPMAFYMRVIVNLSDSVQTHHATVVKRYGEAINSKTVNAYRNKIAVKNAFMKYVVRDSLPWAQRQLEDRLGKFGKSKFVVREYYEEIEQADPAEQPQAEDQIKEEKPEEKGKEEDIKVKRVYLNPEKEEFVNEPMHRPHLKSKRPVPR